MFTRAAATVARTAAVRATPVRAAACARALASQRWASTLVVADAEGGELGAATLNTVSAATAIGGDVTVLVVGEGVAGAGAAAAKVAGVSKVLVADDPAYAHGIAENVSNAVEAAHAAGGYSHILASSTNSAKNWLPRLAARLDVQPLTDVSAVVDETTFQRGMYAGNAVATVKSTAAVHVMTVRGTGFEKAAAEGGSAAVEDAPAAASPDAGKSTFVSEEKTKSDRPELSSARVVVSGGRGMKSGENFEMLYALADKLGAAVGASRAAVDAGFVPNDMQVGQTGKVVAPDLYIAVGISGAIQHLAGMKDSKTIVCINKDPEAPIFSVSDYGLEADLFDAVPEFSSKV